MGGSRRTWREPTQAQGEHANSTQKHPDLEMNPGPCEATVLTTAPPAHSILSIELYNLTGPEIYHFIRGNRVRE